MRGGLDRTRFFESCHATHDNARTRGLWRASILGSGCPVFEHFARMIRGATIDAVEWVGYMDMILNEI